MVKIIISAVLSGGNYYHSIVTYGNLLPTPTDDNKGIIPANIEENIGYNSHHHKLRIALSQISDSNTKTQAQFFMIKRTVYLKLKMLFVYLFFFYSLQISYFFHIYKYRTAILDCYASIPCPTFYALLF
jgi:hypothetical protein